MIDQFEHGARPGVANIASPPGGLRHWRHRANCTNIDRARTPIAGIVHALTLLTIPVAARSRRDPLAVLAAS